MSNYTKYQSPDFTQTLNTGWSIIEVRTGSDSDFPKIEEFLDGLKKANIPYILRILSAHRTPQDMMETAQAFPETLLPHDIRGAIDMSNLRVKFCVAAAGGSAHIAGMTASETQTPVIALPVPSSSCGIMDASFSMINMPPWVPNGFVPNNELCIEMSHRLYNLDLDTDYNTVHIPLQKNSEKAQELMEKLWLEFDQEAKISIGHKHFWSKGNRDIADFNILIPTIGTDMSEEEIKERLLQFSQDPAVYMWIQKIQESGINYTNALVYAAQIIAMFNPTVSQKLDAYKKSLQDEVRAKERDLFVSQTLTPLKRKIFDSWLWPRDKKICLEKWLPELEDLGYELFYRGKNADLYVVLDSHPIQVLSYRTDRTSVFDIPLDLEIEWKWAIQSQISKLWAKFAEERGFKTCYAELPDDIPESLRDRCQLMELCKPLTMEIDGKQKWLELIMRNYNTGSFYKLYEQEQDPYELSLPKWMKEWDKFETPIFTPTTKEKSDTPIASHLVRNRFPDLITRIEQLFSDFTEFMYERWYVVVDTKVEVFINSKWEPVLWDEIFTPESSRFIKKEDFEAGRYISADKQIIRALWEEFGWKEKWKKLKQEFPNSTKLVVSDEVKPEKKQEVRTGYSNILESMQSS